MILLEKWLRILKNERIPRDILNIFLNAEGFLTKAIYIVSDMPLDVMSSNLGLVAVQYFHY